MSARLHENQRVAEAVIGDIAAGLGIDLLDPTQRLDLFRKALTCLTGRSRWIPRKGVVVCAAMATVADVMSSDLITVSPSDSVEEAARMMSRGSTGSALVMDGDRAAAIFTERDIMRALAQANTDIGRSSRVDRWMTRDPVAVGRDATIGEALDIMLGGGFRHLVVVATNGAAVGVVSMRDLAGRIAKP